MKKIVWGLALLVLATNVNAQKLESKKNSWVNSNLIDDNISCFAFYSISEEGLNRSTTHQKVDYTDYKITFTKRTFDLGRETGIKEEALSAKFKIGLEIQKKEIDSDFKNYSILALKYGQFCKDLFDKPENRLAYWNKRSEKEIR